MTNTATKFSFGVEPSAKSRNQELTELLTAIRETVRVVKEVQVMGSLFEALCQLEGNRNSIRLLDYQAHRFLGLTRVAERILEK